MRVERDLLVKALPRTLTGRSEALPDVVPGDARIARGDHGMLQSGCRGRRELGVCLHGCQEPAAGFLEEKLRAEVGMYGHAQERKPEVYRMSTKR